MKVSLLGPTNMEKFSRIVGKSPEEIRPLAEETGKIIAESKCNLIVVFNYSGMLKLVGDSYKKHGGKLEMLYTENDHDWETDIYMKHLKEADVKTKAESWHDMLLRLVKASDLAICAGLSAGVLAELGYMKWNYQEGKGKVKALIGIMEFLRGEKFPPEISFDMEKLIVISSVNGLEKAIEKFKPPL
ncbi:MAG: hypothetical protein HYW25_00015 [Candidatus Aenigmarchaeota archaeon]|nr:hypothetical protein [Candidatus Aenigmarchaeota archaeon]